MNPLDKVTAENWPEDLLIRATNQEASPDGIRRTRSALICESVEKCTHRMNQLSGILPPSACLIQLHKKRAKIRANFVSSEISPTGIIEHDVFFLVIDERDWLALELTFAYVFDSLDPGLLSCRIDRHPSRQHGVKPTYPGIIEVKS